jgi:hypothetical protein
MQEINREDLLQLVKFYKDKVSELELQYVLLQIDNNKKLNSLKTESENNKQIYENSLIKVKEESLQAVYDIKEKKDRIIEDLKKKNKELSSNSLNSKKTKK